MNNNPNSELDKWLSENPDFQVKKETVEDKNNLYKKSNLKEIPELDLHGFNLSNALNLLQEFILNQPKSIHKIRVIHGKGRRSASNKAVLRDGIRNWLKNKREDKIYCIKDYVYEKAENGGTGATLVWLKKRG